MGTWVVYKFKNLVDIQSFPGFELNSSAFPRMSLPETFTEGSQLQVWPLKIRFSVKQSRRPY